MVMTVVNYSNILTFLRIATAFKLSCLYSLVVCVSKTMGNVLLLTSDVLHFLSILQIFCL